MYYSKSPSSWPPCSSQPQRAAGSGWRRPAPAALPGLQGVGIPVRLPRGRGRLRVTLFFGPACAATPEALHDTLDQLEALGVPVDTWEASGNREQRGWSEGSREDGEPWDTGQDRDYGRRYSERDGYRRGYGNRRYGAYRGRY